MELIDLVCRLCVLMDEDGIYASVKKEEGNLTTILVKTNDGTEFELRARRTYLPDHEA